MSESSEDVQAALKAVVEGQATEESQATEEPQADPVVEEQDEVSEDATYTKSDVENLMKKRLAKFSDYDAIATELADLKKKVESGEVTEGAVNKMRAQVTKEANVDIAKARAEAMAASMGFHYPSDAGLYINAEEAIDENGVNNDLIKSQLEKVSKERPALVRSTSSTAVGLGVTGKAPKKTTAQQFADVLGN